MHLRFLLLFLLFFSLGGYSAEKLNDEEQAFLDSVLEANRKAVNDTVIVRNYMLLAGSLYQINIDTLKYFCTKAIEIGERNLKEGTLDSLERRVYNESLASAYNNLGFYYNFTGKPLLALESMQKSIGIKKELGDLKSVAITLNNIAFINSNLGRTNESLLAYLRCIEIQKSINDKWGIATSLNNIAATLENKGNIQRAIDYYSLSLKIRSEINDKPGMADCFNNLGLVFQDQREYSKAKEYYLQSMKIRDEIGDKVKLAVSLNNLGLLHQNQNMLDSALFYYKKSMKLKEETGDIPGIAYSLNSIAGVFYIHGNFDSCRVYYNRSLSICEETGDKYWIADNLYGLGLLERTEGNNKAAEELLDRSFKISEELGYPESIVKSAEILSKIYEEKGDYKASLNYHKQLSEMKDSIRNAGTEKAAIRQGIKYEYEKSLLEKQKEQEIKDAIAKEEKRQQRIVLYSVILILLLLAAFTVIIYNRLKVTRKQKKIIEQHKSELEDKNEELFLQNEEIMAQRDKIEQQKEIVEEKNKEITDSINYAQRIQKAFLKSDQPLFDELPEHFILFRPKDIVSGDFYWIHTNDSFIYFAVADCTGHGVPGAFMSMLGIAFLNEIVSGNTSLSPNQILNLFRSKIIHELSQQSGTGSSKDGMDISLIRVHKDSGLVEWSGANNPIYIVRQNGEDSFSSESLSEVNTHLGSTGNSLYEIKPDKMPIAIYVKMDPFTNHNIRIEKGDIIYLFSDGFADQFGGDKGKKYKYKPFKEFLLSISSKNSQDQKSLLSDEFENWKGSFEQVDDVCVAGIRF